MELVGVRVELPASAPIVLLRESTDRGLFLPIFVGSAEATSIALAMDQVEPPRPITHDLLALVIHAKESFFLFRPTHFLQPHNSIFLFTIDKDF